MSFQSVLLTAAFAIVASGVVHAEADGQPGQRGPEFPLLLHGQVEGDQECAFGRQWPDQAATQPDEDTDQQGQEYEQVGDQCRPTGLRPAGVEAARRRR